MLKLLPAAIVGASLLCACTPDQEARISAFEAKAAPVVQRACADFRAAEASPLVQVAVSAGAVAVTASTGFPAGLAVAATKAFGDEFCTKGPPAGDASTAAQQAAWLSGQVTQQMLSLAGEK